MKLRLLIESLYRNPNRLEFGEFLNERRKRISRGKVIEANIARIDIDIKIDELCLMIDERLWSEFDKKEISLLQESGELDCDPTFKTGKKYLTF